MLRMFLSVVVCLGFLTAISSAQYPGQPGHPVRPGQPVQPGQPVRPGIPQPIPPQLPHHPTARPVSAPVAAPGHVHHVVALPINQVENYFLKNTVKPAPGMKSRSGVITSYRQFDAMFGAAAVMNRHQKFLPKNFFDRNALVFYTEWGNTPWEYKPFQFNRVQDTIELKLARDGRPSPTAIFSPTIILAVPKNLLPPQGDRTPVRVEIINRGRHGR